MLALWLAAYKQSGNEWPVTVITDDPHTDPLGLPMVIVYDDGMPRSGAMHRAGAIKIASFSALRLHGHVGPVVAVDCDIVHVLPMHDLADICDGAHMAIAPNAWRTAWPWIPELDDEKNTGLIWLASDEPYRLWAELWPYYYGEHSECRNIGYSDEIVQSLIWQLLGGPELDCRFNLSHREDHLYGEARAVHFHGPNKDKMAQFMASRGIL